ncbi:hypothetical protein [Prescottella agglutinans]|uniref:Uncharacterized protein n=1 Tax=Prescottella agglutinans TaxID=1644129 RepID=A0ABT6MJ88_9NOCA|nr:hypothetical protein [Prescottella agglutinans]MDH6283934.1 hypothetical protein [Prescottella agglutinans]
MDLRSFFADHVSLWNKETAGVHRSTRHRIATAGASPSLDTIEALVANAGYRTEVTSSSLTPLPSPRPRDSAPLPSSTVVPLFETDHGVLIGDIKDNVVEHVTGSGGTHLLAVFALVAHGIGWDTWMVDPKQIDHTLFFPHMQRASTTVDEHRRLLSDALDRVRAGGDRPLLVTVDVATFVVAQSPQLRDLLQEIVDDGPAAGVHLNMGIKPGTHPVTGLRGIRIVGHGSLLVDNEPTTRPVLFADYIRDGDHTDVDYRRFLRFAVPTSGRTR